MTNYGDYVNNDISQNQYFHTCDGVTLKSLEDLLYYVTICNNENFAYHAKERKNAFVNRVSAVFHMENLA